MLLHAGDVERKRRRPSWSWFAGADERVLALVPSERSFLEAQGLVIFAMALVTGFAVTVAGSGWWNVPITHILWLGLVWTVVICIVDRLIYKSFGTSRRANLVLAVPRAVLSLMLALVLGLPMVQFIFKPSISNQLTLTSAAAQKDARKAALVFYEPKIAKATKQISAIQDHETSLENRISKFTRLSGCEDNEPSCSHTHRTGCGHWCQYYARQATIARATFGGIPRVQQGFDRGQTRAHVPPSRFSAKTIRAASSGSSRATAATNAGTSTDAGQASTHGATA